MKPLDLPDMRFSAWTPWRHRQRLAEEFDVPLEFGLYGIYLLATDDVDHLTSNDSDDRHLHPAVMYVGMSTHVDRRIDRHHQAVVDYATSTGDVRKAKLRYSMWQSDWNTYGDEKQRTYAKALVALCERALLFSYVEAYGRLPVLNRM
ncbi:hypothetical protein [Paraburkholderia sp. MM5482-R1]|uniref:hypothetical protein n=1 Tax=unclassified Paraburkholderia TaxID=2615204 RepID=UPI003D260D5B